MIKKILMIKLRFLSKWALRKYNPKIVAITGSIGKTSTKEAIYCLLSSRFRCRTSIKNYNNELGVPLTILGQESGGNSIWGWAYVLLRSLHLCLFRDKNFPEVLVLEYGVDHPGDMKYLVGIARPDIGIVTAISYSHIEFFGNIEEIRKEKQIIIEETSSQGVSILNYDSEGAKKMSSASKARVISYGIKNKADIMAADIHLSFGKGEIDDFGIRFKLSYEGAVVAVFLPGVMSDASVYACLAAAAVAVAMEMNLVEISSLLSKVNMPNGRMKLISGVKNTYIIDDTYNSSPESAMLAVETLAKLPVSGRKIAVLGDMLELGSFSQEGHRMVGEKIKSKDIDILVTVGERARDIAQAAEDGGFSRDLIWRFDRSEEAGRFIQNQIVSDDIVLVKASQGMRLEKIVKELMAEPDRAKELLVRQGKGWE